MKTQHTKGIKPMKFLVFFMVLTFVVFLLPQTADAAALTALSDTMSRLEKSIDSNHTIRFTTPTGVDDASATITVTMPAGFTIGSVVFGDIDLSHGASTGYETEETLAAAASDTEWGAVFAGQVLTLTHPTNAANGDITATDKVIVEIGTNASGGSNQITNHATAATYTIEIGGTFGDDGKIAVVILDDDQFTVSADVDPTLTFSLSANATAFGTLSDSSVTTSSPNIVLTISTNGDDGYTISILDTGDTSNPGLYSSENSFMIGSADYSYSNSADLSAVAGYGIQGSSGDATIASPYNVSSDNVGGYEITAQTLATYTGVASAHTVTITSKAKVSSVTPAGSYSDTVTTIATGNF
ncbi:hypothetical protein ACFL24_01330 [Patescibacteria group bacterium]